VGGLAAALVGMWVGSARAQEADGEQQITEGNAPHAWGSGVRLSEDMTLHPHADMEVAYQSNVFYGDSAADGKIGSPVMRFGVGAKLTTEPREGISNPVPPQRLVLNGDLNLMWHQYLPTTSTSSITENDISSHSDLGVGLLLDARVNPQGQLTFEAHEGYLRAVTPPPVATTEDADRDKNEAYVGLIGRPGGGAIEIYGRYTYGLELFENNTFDIGTRQSHIVAVGSRWQWLPKTQFNGEASFGGMFKGSKAPANDGVSTPLRVTVGTSTLLTPAFGTVLRVGYGQGFYSGGDFVSYVALAEGRLALGKMRFAFGYSHDFADALIGNFHADHAFYVRYVTQVGGNLNVHAKGELRLRSYGGIPMTSGGGAQFCSNSGCTGSDRSDLLGRVEAGVDLQDTLVQDSTDFGTRTGTTFDPAAFTWQEFAVKATANY
jgi:hypothetical protein